MLTLITQQTTGCTSNCRIRYESVAVATSYFQPVYDENGVNTNPPRNTLVGECNCATCGRAWDYLSRDGECTYMEKHYANSSV